MNLRELKGASLQYICELAIDEFTLFLREWLQSLPCTLWFFILILTTILLPCVLVGVAIWYIYRRPGDQKAQMAQASIAWPPENSE
jgi:uncharacterized membrane protein